MSGLDLKARLRVTAAIDGAALTVSDGGARYLLQALDGADRVASRAMLEMDRAIADRDRYKRLRRHLFLSGFLFGTSTGIVAGELIGWALS